MSHELLSLSTVPQESHTLGATYGVSLQRYSQSLGPGRAESIQKSSLEILDKLFARGPHSSTGLVLGHVQSGKTASIIGVMAAARDNDFPLIVIASGMTELLQSQTLSRVRESLELDVVRGEWLVWGTASKATEPDLISVLSQWKRWFAGIQEQKPPTVVYIPLKTSGIERTASSIRSSLKLIGTDLPLLVIDDESDSASPNTESKKNLDSGGNLRSTTSRRINNLYQSSSKTKFLMYTATPQANLLMDLNEQLDPEFCHLLEPGEGYMGFQTYFLSDQADHFLRAVPSEDVVKPSQKHFPVPDSALSAIATFVVGCALQLEEGVLDIRSAKTVRTLMMQVAAKKHAHEHFAKIATAVTSTWREIEELFSDSPHESEVFLIHSFDDLANYDQAKKGVRHFRSHIRTVLNNLKILILNSDSSPSQDAPNAGGVSDRINWADYPFWILVGGIFLDRGFTVLGLQVTYMPRTPASNEDTITQRARFFGYHGQYRDYIRLFLPDTLRAAYKSIGQNALDLRSAMAAYGGDLRSWKRDLGVTSGLMPTRKSVIGRSLNRVTDAWVYPQDLHQVDESAQKHNVTLLRALLETAKLKLEFASEANLRKYGIFNPKKAFIVESVPLSNLVKILERFAYPAHSSGAALLKGCEEDALSSRHSQVTLVFIDHLETSNLRGKSLGPIEPIGNLLMSGSSSKFTEGDARSYPGDRQVFNPSQPTIQLRLIKSNPWLGSEGRNMEFAWWAWRNPVLGERVRE